MLVPRPSFSATSSDDDLWADSSEDGHAGGDQRELDREATARHQQFYNAGYRDGLDEGKEKTLQQGFDIGFREGAAAGFEWGLLRGAVATLAALQGQAAGTRGLGQQIEALRAAADVPPRAAMLGTFRELLSAPMPPTQPQQQHAQAAPSAQAACAAGPTDAAHAPPAEGEQDGNTGAGADACASCSGSGDGIAAEGAAHGTGDGSGAAGGADAGGPEAEALGAALRGLSTSEADVAGAGVDDQPAAASGTGIGSAPTSVSAEAQAGPAAAAAHPYTLPPDAARLSLPDMAQLRADLRQRLQELGFDVGQAPQPLPCTAQPPARQ